MGVIKKKIQVYMWNFIVRALQTPNIVYRGFDECSRTILIWKPRLAWELTEILTYLGKQSMGFVNEDIARSWQNGSSIHVCVEWTST